MNTIGENIRLARTERGLKQMELAQLLGMKTEGTIRQWELGIRVPKLDSIKKIAAVMGLTADQLIRYDKPDGMSTALEYFEKKMTPAFRKAEEMDQAVNDANGYDPTAMRDTVPDCMVNRSEVYAKTVNAIDRLAEDLDKSHK